MKRFTGIWLVLVLVLLGGRPETGYASGRWWLIRPYVEVARDNVTLRDLLVSPHAVEKGASIPLNRPVLRVTKPGETHVSRRGLKQALNRCLPAKTLATLQIPPNGLTIRRVFRVDTKRVEELFRETLLSRYGNLGKIRLREVKISGNREIPDPHYRLVPDPPIRFQKVMRLKIRVLGEGWQHTLFARGRVSIVAKVLIASRYIMKGEKIGPGNTAQVEEDVTHLFKAYLTNLDTCTGMVAKRSIPEGGVISPEALISPLLVHSGAVVTIEVRTPNILIRTLGKAKQPGRRGDIIRVENIQSKKVIYAKVASKNLVTVEF